MKGGTYNTPIARSRQRITLRPDPTNCRRKDGKPKHRFPTMADANAAAMDASFAAYSYRCGVCKGYHLAGVRKG